MGHSQRKLPIWLMQTPLVQMAGISLHSSISARIQHQSPARHPGNAPQHQNPPLCIPGMLHNIRVLPSASRECSSTSDPQEEKINLFSTSSFLAVPNLFSLPQLLIPPMQLPGVRTESQPQPQLTDGFPRVDVDDKSRGLVPTQDLVLGWEREHRGHCWAQGGTSGMEFGGPEGAPGAHCWDWSHPQSTTLSPCLFWGCPCPRILWEN